MFEFNAESCRELTAKAFNAKEHKQYATLISEIEKRILDQCNDGKSKYVMPGCLSEYVKNYFLNLRFKVEYESDDRVGLTTIRWYIDLLP
jgi:predicted Holliday junction resolvase-like endonuclease